MTGYSLQFFHDGRWTRDFWETLTPERASELAVIAKAAGCTPVEFANEVHGVPTAWQGPDTRQVIAAINRARIRLVEPTR